MNFKNYIQKLYIQKRIMLFFKYTWFFTTLFLHKFLLFHMKVNELYWIKKSIFLNPYPLVNWHSAIFQFVDYLLILKTKCTMQSFNKNNEFVKDMINFSQKRVTFDILFTALMNISVIFLSFYRNTLQFCL